MKMLLKISIFFLYGCANMIAPTGGDKDVTAPFLLSVSEKKINTKSNIYFLFDEYIELNSWENHFYISPPFKEDVTKKISNKTLILSINDSIITNTTYHLSLSNTIKDLNEGNIIDSLSFIFGDTKHLDSLKLHGNLKDAYTLVPIENAWVMLYNEETNDSIIFKSTPNYIAKTDQYGDFNFPNLKNNNYKIIALTGFDFLYNKGEKISFLKSTISPNKDSVIQLFSFDPILKSDSLSNDTIENNASINLDSTLQKESPGSLLINSSTRSQVIFQLLHDEKICYSFPFNSSPFLMGNIKPGTYRLKCIIDVNNDKKWTIGDWNNKIQVEKTINHQNEITIRSNWDLELDWELE